MDIIKYKNLSNFEDIKFIYEKFRDAKKYINDNHSDNIMNNINKFITFFINDFKIDQIEQRFIISLFFQYDYFIKEINNNITLPIYRKIIVNKVLTTLNELKKYSSLIDNSIILCNFKENNKKNINYNYSIIKKIIKSKETKNNYYFLFDSIEYFKNDSNKLRSYIVFIDMMLNDYLNTKSYY